MKNKKLKIREKRNNTCCLNSNNNSIINISGNKYKSIRWRKWSNNENKNSQRRK